MFRIRSYQQRFRKTPSFNAFLQLSGETDGFVLDVINDTVLVRDSSTPTNNFVGTMAEALSNGILVYPSPSTKLILDSAGAWQSGTALRCHYSATGVPLGLLPEPQRTNGIPNNTMVGAAAGTPGTPPTGWAIVLLGCSQEVVGAGSLNGIDYIDLRIYGTPTSTNRLSIGFSPSSTIVASEAQVWNLSTYLAIVGGSLANISSVTLATNWQGPGSTKRGSSFSASLSSTLTRFESSLTAPASTTYTLPKLELNLTNGSAVDITLRIGLPQMELGAFATSPIKTSGSAVTRAPDNLYVDLTKVPALGSEFTVLGEAEPCPDVQSNAFVLYDLYKDANDRAYLRNATAGNLALQLINRSGGSDTASIVSVNNSATPRYKFAAAHKADDYELVTKGVSRGTDASGALAAGMTLFYLGRGQAGGQYSAPIGSVALIPERLSQADMIARTTL